MARRGSNPHPRFRRLSRRLKTFTLRPPENTQTYLLLLWQNIWTAADVGVQCVSTPLPYLRVIPRSIGNESMGRRPRVDADRRRRLASAAGLLQRVFPPAAAPVAPENARAARPLRVVGPAAPRDHRHQKRITRRLRVANHAHGPEAAVQQQQARPHAHLAHATATGVAAPPPASRPDGRRPTPR